MPAFISFPVECDSDSEDDVVVHKRRQPNKDDPLASQMVKNEVKHLLSKMTDLTLIQAETRIFNTKRQSFHYIILNDCDLYLQTVQSTSHKV